MDNKERAALHEYMNYEGVTAMDLDSIQREYGQELIEKMIEKLKKLSELTQLTARSMRIKILALMTH